MKKLFFYSFLFFCLNAIGLHGQTILDKSFEHDGLTRTYKVFLPAAYEEGATLPVVINLHGYAASAENQMEYTEMNNVADTAGFIVVYPQGVIGETPWPGTANIHWNAYYNDEVDDMGFLDRMIDYLYTDFNIDLTRVYATGLSNGGFMSYRLACELSDRIAAIASVAGSMLWTLYQNCDPGRPVPVMEIRGTADVVVPYYDNLYHPGVDDVIRLWRDINQCSPDVTLTTFPNISLLDYSTVTLFLYPNCAGNTEVAFYQILNGGHTWPDGSIDVYTLGNTNRDINASEKIWEFFNRHSHPSPREGTIISAVFEDEPPTNAIKVFPNPGKDWLLIEGRHGIILESIQLIDLSGRIIIEESGAHSSKKRLDLNHLEKGVYMLKVEAKNDVWTEMIIKL